MNWVTKLLRHDNDVSVGGTLWSDGDLYVASGRYIKNSYLIKHLGDWYIANNANNTVLLSLTDAGALTVNGPINASGALSVTGTVSAWNLSLPWNGALTWPNDAFGGSGDFASMWLGTRGGESQSLVINVGNDADDWLELRTPANDGVKVNGNTVYNAGSVSPHVITLFNADTFWTLVQQEAFDYPASSAYTSNAGGSGRMSDFSFFVDPGLVAGRTVYLEVVMRASSGTVQVILATGVASGIVESRISTASTSFVRLRSAAISASAIQNNAVFIASEIPGVNVGEIKSAKLIVI
jgi:hypothetical protein